MSMNTSPAINAIKTPASAASRKNMRVFLSTEISLKKLMQNYESRRHAAMTQRAVQAHIRDVSERIGMNFASRGSDRQFVVDGAASWRPAIHSRPLKEVRR
jgi:hypothetical protein